MAAAKNNRKSSGTKSRTSAASPGKSASKKAASAKKTRAPSSKPPRKKAVRRTPAKKAVPAARPERRPIVFSRVMIVFLIVISWALCLITEFSMGIAGRFLHGLLQFLIGNVQLLLLPALMVLGGWYIAKKGEKAVPGRWWGALFSFVLFFSSAAALLSMPESDVWKPLADCFGQLRDAGLSAVTSAGGLSGSLLAGFLASLFSRAGAWIFTALFLVLSILLFGWQEICRVCRTLIGKPAKAAAAGVRKVSQLAVPQDGADSHAASETPVFTGLRNGGIEADFTDAPSVPSNPSAAQPVMQGSVFENGILFDEDILPDESAQKTASQLQADENTASGTDEGGKRQTGKRKKPVRKAAPGKGRSTEPAASAETEPALMDADSEPVLQEPKDKAQPGRINRKPETAVSQEDQSSAPVSQSVSGAPYGPEAMKNYQLPPAALLKEPKSKGRSSLNARMAKTDGEKLIGLLREFGVEARLGDIHIGPSVTKFEVIPGQGVRVSTIVNLQNDIKMALAATDIRIEAPIPGKSAVGIEVPNAEKTTVAMKELMTAIPPRLSKLPLVFALGKDLLGDNVYGRLDTMPHLLIAGATGSGKSVCVNSIICSILMRTRPDEVKLLLVDPKKVEFTPYNGVPHLLSPVITDGDLAGKALKVIVEMMDRRYDLFEETGVRHISGYNAYVSQHPKESYQPLPRIVVIIDELADLMLAAPKEVEQSIQRITQLARAAGIHLIVATQRPSVNVITGVIKANIPSRIAFAVSSATDSRTILDQAGAERLLGYGDMLFLDNGDASPRRIQGVFIQDEEVSEVARYARSQAAPMYDDAFVTLKDLQSQGGQVSAENTDPLYNDVKSYVISTGKASTSLIQRRFSIGYGRAARIMDVLEANGIVGPANGTRPRELLSHGAAESDF